MSSTAGAWLVALCLFLPAAARADALPSCPPGTHMVMSPTPPGAMHHGGGGCVPDEVAPEAPPGDPTAPTPPVAPVETPPAATPPATPEAALPTAPVSAPSVPAPSPVPTAEPAPSSGMCTARPYGSASPIVLAATLALLLLRRRR